MDTKLSGARVLVTAGGSGIGLTTALTFAREGARVHVCDVEPSHVSKLREIAPAITSSLCDVSDPGQVLTMFAEAAEALGGLDTLVNNAGIAGPTAPCVDVALEDWN